MYSHTHIYTYSHILSHMYVYIYMFLIHTFIDMIYVCICFTFSYTCIWCICLYIYIYTQIRTFYMSTPTRPLISSDLTVAMPPPLSAGASLFYSFGWRALVHGNIGNYRHICTYIYIYIYTLYTCIAS